MTFVSMIGHPEEVLKWTRTRFVLLAYHREMHQPMGTTVLKRNPEISLHIRRTRMAMLVLITKREALVRTCYPLAGGKRTRDFSNFFYDLSRY